MYSDLGAEGNAPIRRTGCERHRGIDQTISVFRLILVDVSLRLPCASLSFANRSLGHSVFPASTDGCGPTLFLCLQVLSSAVEQLLRISLAYVLSLHTRQSRPGYMHFRRRINACS